MELTIACPLCSQPGFSDVNSLWLSLIRATTRQLKCPVCQEILCGLDKLTIHLVSHSLHEQLVQACAATNFLSQPTNLVKNTDLNNSVSVVSQESTSTLNTQTAPVASYVLINFPNVGNVSTENQNQCPPGVSAGVNVAENKKSISYLSPQEMDFPAVGICKSKDTTLALNETAQAVHQNSINGLRTPTFLPHSFQSECLLSEVSPVDKKVERSCSLERISMQDYNSPSQCNLLIVRDIAKESKLQSSEKIAFNSENNLKGEARTENKSSEISGPLVSCRECCLTFKDNKIAMLHQQLIHNGRPKDENQHQLSPKTDERNTSKPCKTKRSSSFNQHRDGASPLHKFPCHVCNKVFRMRGSLMVHLRVAHSLEGTAGLASQHCRSSTYSNPQSGDVASKLPIQNLSLKETNSSFPSVENLSDTGNLVSVVNDPQIFKQTGSSHPNLSATHELVKEQTSVNQLPPKDLCSSKSLMSSVSPSMSPTQSISVQASCVESVGMIFPCNFCSKTFSKEALLTQHLKSHDSKQWECDVCFKSFTTKYFLKKHKRLHTGEMPYTCGICNKSFTFQQSYHKHLLYHSDEKPHSCNECGRAFKELSTLHNHQRIHTGEKPWACETCGKCFRQRVSYLVHRRIHTGAMPYQCTICLKSFRYKVSQRTHKCIALPIADSTSQSTDFLQHFLLSSNKEMDSQSVQASPVSEASYKQSQKLLRHQLQQMNIKQENQLQSFTNHLLHPGNTPENQILSKNESDNSSQVKGCTKSELQEIAHENITNNFLHPANPPGNQVLDKNEIHSSSQVNGCIKSEHQALQMQHDSRENHVATPLSTSFNQYLPIHPLGESVSKDSPGSSHKPSSDFLPHHTSLESHQHNSSSDFPSSLSHSTLHSSSTDFNIDLFQDILSMVMSPACDSASSPSTQLQHLSLTSQNDEDLESGLELRQLLYGCCESDSNS